ESVHVIASRHIIAMESKASIVFPLAQKLSYGGLESPEADKSGLAIVACPETNATGNFLRRYRHGYLGSSCHAVRFLFVSRDHIVRERSCLRDGHSLLCPRWDNIRRRSNNRDNRCLRSGCSPSCVIRCLGRVRIPTVWGDGHMQEMWAWVRLQPLFLPFLWAKGGLIQAGR